MKLGSFHPRRNRKRSLIVDAQHLRTASKHIRYSIQDLVPELIAMVSNGTNAAQGEKLLEELMTSAFWSRYGSEMTALGVKNDFFTGEKTHTLTQLTKTRREEAQTEEWEVGKFTEDDDGEKRPAETKFSDWQSRDKFEAGVIFGLLPVAMGASAVTAQSNLTGTGLPVFTDNVLLPWTMAVLAPISGLAIKSIWHGITSRRWKKVFSNVLNAATFVSIGTWVWLFSDQYHGLSASNAVGGLFDEPTAFEDFKQTAFVGATLVTEVLITSVLAHRLDVIWERYAPHFRYRNLDSEILQEREERLLNRASHHIDKLADMQGEISAYEADLKLQVNLALIALRERSARFSTSKS